MADFLSQFHYSILPQAGEPTSHLPKTPNRIVFIHGLMAFAANWRKIATRLQNDFECLIYDQRGHGRSMKPDSGYAPTNFADDLNKITEELGWSNFHLVGHSMGARNAMVFSHLYSHKVKTLTLEDMGPENNQSALDYYKRLLEFIPTPFPTKDAVKVFFDTVFVKQFPAKEPMTVLSTFLQANLEEQSAGPYQGKYDWKFSKKAIFEIVEKGNSRDLWVEVSSFKMPVLVIRGENSHVFSREVFEKMQLVNANISGVEISGASHWVHYEKSEEFVACVRKFILSHAQNQSN